MKYMKFITLSVFTVLISVTVSVAQLSITHSISPLTYTAGMPTDNIHLSFEVISIDDNVDEVTVYLHEGWTNVIVTRVNVGGVDKYLQYGTVVGNDPDVVYWNYGAVSRELWFGIADDQFSTDVSVVVTLFAVPQRQSAPQVFFTFSAEQTDDPPESYAETNLDPVAVEPDEATQIVLTDAEGEGGVALEDGVPEQLIVNQSYEFFVAVRDQYDNFRENIQEANGMQVSWNDSGNNITVNGGDTGYTLNSQEPGSDVITVTWSGFIATSDNIIYNADGPDHLVIAALPNSVTPLSSFSISTDASQDLWVAVADQFGNFIENLDSNDNLAWSNYSPYLDLEERNGYFRFHGSQPDPSFTINVVQDGVTGADVDVEVTNGAEAELAIRENGSLIEEIIITAGQELSDHEIVVLDQDGNILGPATATWSFAGLVPNDQGGTGTVISGVTFTRAPDNGTLLLDNGALQATKSVTVNVGDAMTVVPSLESDNLVRLQSAELYSQEDTLRLYGLVVDDNDNVVTSVNRDAMTWDLPLETDPSEVDNSIDAWVLDFFPEYGGYTGTFSPVLAPYTSDSSGSVTVYGGRIEDITTDVADAIPGGTIELNIDVVNLCASVATVESIDYHATPAGMIASETITQSQPSIPPGETATFTYAITLQDGANQDITFTASAQLTVEGNTFSVDADDVSLLLELDEAPVLSASDLNPSEVTRDQQAGQVRIQLENTGASPTVDFDPDNTFLRFAGGVTNDLALISPQSIGGNSSAEFIFDSATFDTDDWPAGNYTVTFVYQADCGGSLLQDVVTVGTFSCYEIPSPVFVWSEGAPSGITGGFSIERTIDISLPDNSDLSDFTFDDADDNYLYMIHPDNGSYLFFSYSGVSFPVNTTLLNDGSNSVSLEYELEGDSPGAEAFEGASGPLYFHLSGSSANNEPFEDSFEIVTSFEIGEAIQCAASADGDTDLEVELTRTITYSINAVDPSSNLILDEEDCILHIDADVDQQLTPVQPWDTPEVSVSNGTTLSFEVTISQGTFTNGIQSLPAELELHYRELTHDLSDDVTLQLDPIDLFERAAPDSNGGLAPDSLICNTATGSFTLSTSNESDSISMTMTDLTVTVDDQQLTASNVTLPAGAINQVIGLTDFLTIATVGEYDAEVEIEWIDELGHTGTTSFTFEDEISVVTRPELIFNSLLPTHHVLLVGEDYAPTASLRLEAIDDDGTTLLDYVYADDPSVNRMYFERTSNGTEFSIGLSGSGSLTSSVSSLEFQSFDNTSSFEAGSDYEVRVDFEGAYLHQDDYTISDTLPVYFTVADTPSPQISNVSLTAPLEIDPGDYVDGQLTVSNPNSDAVSIQVEDITCSMTRDGGACDTFAIEIQGQYPVQVDSGASQDIAFRVFTTGVADPGIYRLEPIVRYTVPLSVNNDVVHDLEGGYCQDTIYVRHTPVLEDRSLAVNPIPVTVDQNTIQVICSATVNDPTDDEYDQNLYPVSDDWELNLYLNEEPLVSGTDYSWSTDSVPTTPLDHGDDLDFTLTFDFLDENMDHGDLCVRLVAVYEYGSGSGRTYEYVFGNQHEAICAVEYEPELVIEEFYFIPDAFTVSEPLTAAEGALCHLVLKNDGEADLVYDPDEHIAAIEDSLNQAFPDAIFNIISTPAEDDTLPGGTRLTYNWSVEADEIPADDFIGEDGVEIELSAIDGNWLNPNNSPDYTATDTLEFSGLSRPDVVFNTITPAHRTLIRDESYAPEVSVMLEAVDADFDLETFYINDTPSENLLIIDNGTNDYSLELPTHPSLTTNESVLLFEAFENSDQFVAGDDYTLSIQFTGSYNIKDDYVISDTYSTEDHFHIADPPAPQITDCSLNDPEVDAGDTLTGSLTIQNSGIYTVPIQIESISCTMVDSLDQTVTPFNIEIDDETVVIDADASDTIDFLMFTEPDRLPGTYVLTPSFSYNVPLSVTPEAPATVTANDSCEDIVYVRHTPLITEDTLSLPATVSTGQQNVLMSLVGTVVDSTPTPYDGALSPDTTLWTLELYLNGDLVDDALYDVVYGELSDTLTNDSLIEDSIYLNLDEEFGHGSLVAELTAVYEYDDQRHYEYFFTNYEHCRVQNGAVLTIVSLDILPDTLTAASIPLDLTDNVICAVTIENTGEAGLIVTNNSFRDTIETKLDEAYSQYGFNLLNGNDTSYTIFGGTTHTFSWPLEADSIPNDDNIAIDNLQFMGIDENDELDTILVNEQQMIFGGYHPKAVSLTELSLYNMVQYQNNVTLNYTIFLDTGIGYDTLYISLYDVTAEATICSSFIMGDLLPTGYSDTASYRSVFHVDPDSIIAFTDTLYHHIEFRYCGRTIAPPPVLDTVFVSREDSFAVYEAANLDLALEIDTGDSCFVENTSANIKRLNFIVNPMEELDEEVSLSAEPDHLTLRFYDPADTDFENPLPGWQWQLDPDEEIPIIFNEDDDAAQSVELQVTQAGQAPDTGTEVVARAVWVMHEEFSGQQLVASVFDTFTIYRRADNALQVTIGDNVEHFPNWMNNVDPNYVNYGQSGTKPVLLSHNQADAEPLSSITVQFDIPDATIVEQTVNLEYPFGFSDEGSVEYDVLFIEEPVEVRTSRTGEGQPTSLAPDGIATQKKGNRLTEQQNRRGKATQRSGFSGENQNELDELDQLTTNAVARVVICVGHHSGEIYTAQPPMDEDTVHIQEPARLIPTIWIEEAPEANPFWICESRFFNVAVQIEVAGEAEIEEATVSAEIDPDQFNNSTPIPLDYNLDGDPETFTLQADVEPGAYTLSFTIEGTVTDRNTGNSAEVPEQTVSVDVLVLDTTITAGNLVINPSGSDSNTVSTGQVARANMTGPGFLDDAFERVDAVLTFTTDNEDNEDVLAPNTLNCTFEEGSGEDTVVWDLRVANDLWPGGTTAITVQPHFEYVLHYADDLGGSTTTTIDDLDSVTVVLAPTAHLQVERTYSNSSGYNEQVAFTVGDTIRAEISTFLHNQDFVDTSSCSLGVWNPWDDSAVGHYWDDSSWTHTQEFEFQGLIQVEFSPDSTGIYDLGFIFEGIPTDVNTGLPTPVSRHYDSRAVHIFEPPSPWLTLDVAPNRIYDGGVDRGRVLVGYFSTGAPLVNDELEVGITSANGAELLFYASQDTNEAPLESTIVTLNEETEFYFSYTLDGLSVDTTDVLHVAANDTAPLGIAIDSLSLDTASVRGDSANLNVLPVIEPQVQGERISLSLFDSRVIQYRAEFEVQNIGGSECVMWTSEAPFTFFLNEEELDLSNVIKGRDNLGEGDKIAVPAGSTITFYQDISLIPLLRSDSSQLRVDLNMANSRLYYSYESYLQLEQILDLYDNELTVCSPIPTLLTTSGGNVGTVPCGAEMTLEFSAPMDQTTADALKQYLIEEETPLLMKSSGRGSHVYISSDSQFEWRDDTNLTFNCYQHGEWVPGIFNGCPSDTTNIPYYILNPSIPYELLRSAEQLPVLSLIASKEVNTVLPLGLKEDTHMPYMERPLLHTPLNADTVILSFWLADDAEGSHSSIRSGVDSSGIVVYLSSADSSLNAAPYRVPDRDMQFYMQVPQHYDDYSRQNLLVSLPGDTLPAIRQQIGDEQDLYVFLDLEDRSNNRTTAYANLDTLAVYAAEHQDRFLVYPNPLDVNTTDRLFTQFYVEPGARFDMVLTDLNGRLIAILFEDGNPNPAVLSGNLATFDDNEGLEKHKHEFTNLQFFKALPQGGYPVVLSNAGATNSNRHFVLVIINRGGS